MTVIDDYAFYHCENMENLVIPDFVSKIGIYAFHLCKKITEITIPNLVTDIGDFAFDNCSNLTIVNYNAENCIGARGEKVYNGCFAFKTLNIGDKVTIIPARGFADCKKLTDLKIGNSVTKIGNSAFENCLGLTEVVIPDSVIEIGDYAFAGCDSVTNIKIGNSVTDIGAEAFLGCRLTELVIPKSVYRIGYKAFSGNYLSSILVEDGNQRFDSRDNCNAIILTAGNELKVGCKNTIIPNTVNEIGPYAFSGCNTLKEIEIPNSITRIGKYAFHRCERLSVVTIPNSVTRIDDLAFSECYFLTTIEFNAENCSYMGHGSNPVFNQCLVENISIGNSVKNIPEAAFCDLKYLKKIVIPNSVTKIGKEAFAGCIRLDSIIVEDGNATYDSRGNSNVIIETATNTLIAGCNRSVIPNSVQRIEDYAFWGYSDLTDITIPSSVTYIGRDVFKNTGWYEKQPDNLLYLDNCCLGRKEYAPVGDVCLDPNTRLIAGGAFEDCRGITSVKMGNSVVSIVENLMILGHGK